MCAIKAGSTGQNVIMKGACAAPLKHPPMKGVPPFKLPSSYEPAAYGGVVLSL